jgi:hypothetical protein
MNFRSKGVKNTRRKRVSKRINGGVKFSDLLKTYNAKAAACYKKCDDESKPDLMQKYVSSAQATPNGWYMEYSAAYQGYPDIYTITHGALRSFGISSSSYGDREFSEYLEIIEELPNPLKTYRIHDKIFKLGSDAKKLHWEDQFDRTKHPFNPSSPLKIGQDIATLIA